MMHAGLDLTQPLAVISRAALRSTFGALQRSEMRNVWAAGLKGKAVL